MATDLATLQTWLSEALAARHALITGTKAQTLSSGDRSVTYTQAPDSINALNAYIQDLTAQISAAQDPRCGGRSAIGVIF